VSHGPRPAWHFDYSPLPSGSGHAGEACIDVILATTEDVDPARIVELVGRDVPELAVTPLFSGYPVFWTRLESRSGMELETLVSVLSEGGIGVRYVTSAQRGNQLLPPPLDFSEARTRRARDWSVRAPTTREEPDAPWRWFLRPEGADVSREHCGTGAGSRLAVIDNDGGELERVALDAEVPVGVGIIPRGLAHAGMMIGWAVGATREDGTAFRGVAPDASPRAYLIPKPGADVWTLPLAILRAVDDGADVVVCATYVEGLTSPLLDDALEFAVRLGRGGAGTAIVMPTGREMSSPEGSTHSSLSLSLADPAADPRVFCVGPSARDGGWFLWRDRRGRLRPFANRGPAVRWLAPGDDMAYPFSVNDRAAHAESSGASGICGGVLLLLLARFPELSLREAEAYLRLGEVRIDAERQSLDSELADRRDLQPLGVDRDGHNAKHGYGRLSARNACTAAADPVAQALLRMGEASAAHEYLSLLEEGYPKLVSTGLRRWAARQLLGDAALVHGVMAIVRALRLTCHDRAAGPLSEPAGQWSRQLGVVLRGFAAKEPSPEHAEELRSLDRRLRELDPGATRAFEARLFALFGALWSVEQAAPSRVVELRDSRPRNGGTLKAPHLR
jgi:hypothetical protein